jgi:hypothetical protein
MHHAEARNLSTSVVVFAAISRCICTLRGLVSVVRKCFLVQDGREPRRA